MKSAPRRRILWGYRSDEVPLPPLWPICKEERPGILRIHPSVKVGKVRRTDRNLRRPVAGSLGCHVAGAVCPHPDMRDPSTALDGALYRIGLDIPGYEDRKPEFLEFVEKWCQDNLTPLDPSTCSLDFEDWLAKTHYNEKRKEELRQTNDSIRDPFDKRNFRVNSFIKDEFYPEYKHARTINSRADEFKCLIGPLFYAISEEVFSQPDFIKKIPIHERPEYMHNRLYRAGGEANDTDYSSFEAHFKENFMLDCEFVMYQYMIKNLPNKEYYMKLLVTGLLGENNLFFHWFLFQLLQVRQSGEMNTSLGNSFANLMTIKYVCSKYPACKSAISVVEGDDSLTVVTGKMPPVEVFKQFGLRIKIGTHKDLCRASFCGMVFDEDERTNVTDPREVLATFGWTSARYMRSKKSVQMTLLRCKALSLAYQYPSCPILSALAKRVLFLTRSHETENFVNKQGKFLYNQYDIEIMKMAELRNKQKKLIFADPGPKTRNLVEELYGITVAQQLEIENYFDSMMEIGPLDHQTILDIMPSEWKLFYEKYSAFASPNDAIYEYPTELWPKLKKQTFGLDDLPRHDCRTT